MRAGGTVLHPRPFGDGIRGVSMTTELPYSASKAKAADRGRSKVLALIALYLVLAVSVGAIRSHLQDSPPAPIHTADQIG